MLTVDRTYRFSAILLAACICFSGCEGPVGPVGPEGPSGPEGPIGLPGDAVVAVWDIELQNIHFEDNDNVRTAVYEVPELTEELMSKSVLLAYFVGQPTTWPLPAELGIPGRYWTFSVRYSPGQVTMLISKHFDDPTDTLRYGVVGMTLRIYVLQ